MNKSVAKKYQSIQKIKNYKFCIEYETKSEVRMINKASFDALDSHVQNIALLTTDWLVKIQTLKSIIITSKDISTQQISWLSDLEATANEVLVHCFDDSIQDEKSIDDYLPSSIDSLLNNGVSHSEYIVTSEVLFPYVDLLNKLLEDRLNAISAQGWHIFNMIIRADFNRDIDSEAELKFVDQRKFS